MRPKAVYAGQGPTDRLSQATRDCYDLSWSRLPFEEGDIDDETWIKYGLITSTPWYEAVGVETEDVHEMLGEVLPREDSPAEVA